MNYQDSALTKLKDFEGCISWMYLDSLGNVTVGIGLMLPHADAAKELPFQHNETDPRPASKGQVQAEFARVSQMTPNHLPGYYRTALSPELSLGTMERLCHARIVQGEVALRAILPGYDALPDAAKVALIDMEYNLGAGGLRKYAQLHRALAAGDFSQAATESFRHGIQPARNQWTEQQFLLAAQTRDGGHEPNPVTV